MTERTGKRSAMIELAFFVGTFFALLWVLAGCTPIRGFQYVDDPAIGISAGTARQAAAVARAEADALDAIADENEAATARIFSAVTQATSGLETGILGAILGAGATLFVPPPGTRRKREEAPE